jgi:OmpA-OmpF porin, OOP family
LIRRNFLKLAASAALLRALPVSAQSDPENFNIFFDFGKSDLTDPAKQLLDIIAKTVSPTARVTISGNCDTAEPEPEKLGFARANAVLTQLLRHKSMARVRFHVVNEGASKPMIETPPNTREPRNRRVVVIVTRS